MLEADISISAYFNLEKNLQNFNCIRIVIEINNYLKIAKYGLKII